MLAPPQDAWDTSVSINVEGEDVRFFHTSKSGVERIWVDRCAAPTLHLFFF